MRILIEEDDFASRKFMLKFLSKFGECDVTVDGIANEGTDAPENAYEGILVIVDDNTISSTFVVPPN